MMRKSLFLCVACLLMPAMAWPVQFYKDGDASLDVGYWAQGWYQYVKDIDRNGDGKWDDDLHDFMVRRTYFSVSGTATPALSFFMHSAGDRMGQEGLDNAGMGLGTGLALRDGWVIIDF